MCHSGNPQKGISVIALIRLLLRNFCIKKNKCHMTLIRESRVAKMKTAIGHITLKGNSAFFNSVNGWFTSCWKNLTKIKKRCRHGQGITRCSLLLTFVAFDAFSPENGEKNMLQFVSCLGVFILPFKIRTGPYIKASYVYHATTCIDTVPNRNDVTCLISLDMSCALFSRMRRFLKRLK